MDAEREDPTVLPGTGPASPAGDRAMVMVAGLHRFLDRELVAADSAAHSPAPTTTSRPSTTIRREQLARLIGAVDARLPYPSLELVATLDAPALLQRTPGYEVFAVRWPVFEGVDGEGLVLRPRTAVRANVIALPDADWTPEQVAGLAPGLDPSAQFPCRLAERHCQVVVPVLIDRQDTWSGNPAIRMTNQPHREFIYRMAFELGRHIVGYEVQKVLALVDYFTEAVPQNGLPVGVYGYGEGGLLALHSGALDERIGAVAVSGHFRNRRDAWQEPIYRDIWRLLRPADGDHGFGDAHLAVLIAPRGLVVDAVPGPVVSGPPERREGRQGAAPGSLAPAPPEEVRAEVARARPAYDRLGAGDRLVLVEGGSDATPGTPAALDAFIALLAGNAGPDDGARAQSADHSPSGAAPDGPPGSASARPPDPRARQQRQFGQLCRFTQGLLRQAGRRRDAYWSGADPSSLDTWQRSTAHYRAALWDDVLGRCPPPSLAPNPRSRRVYDRPHWTGYEVLLDVWPDVFAAGVLLVPKDLKPGERRPVVVCQHGLEGRPEDVIDHPGSVYHDFAARLADRGYIVYAPQNPYIGGDAFRGAVRKAHLLGWTIYSFIFAQQQVTLGWLRGLDFVDPSRIAYYGLSYGGKTAMRIPAVLTDYCLSICSGDFNEWIVKCASVDLPMSYMFTGEYEMFEFDLGNTFNYAEMAGLIAPRPFMVERGHRDGVGLDEWVTFEYAKVRRRYADLGIRERTAIAFFEGGHMIHGQDTFAFLDRHLGWVPSRTDTADVSLTR